MFYSPRKSISGSNAEDVKHIHVHVFPRMPHMPPGNIKNLWIGQWMNLLHRLGLKKAHSDDVVAQYAKKLRQAYLEFAHTPQVMK